MKRVKHDMENWNGDYEIVARSWKQIRRLSYEYHPVRAVQKDGGREQGNLRLCEGYWCWSRHHDTCIKKDLLYQSYRKHKGQLITARSKDNRLARHKCSETCETPCPAKHDLVLLE